MFAGTSTAMRAGTLSFTGLEDIELVTVPTSDGQNARALKITAKAITITDFALTVRSGTGRAQETTADAVTLDEGVVLYVSAITATSADGELLAVGTGALPTRETIAAGLRTAAVNLVGMTAGSISYESPEQRVVEARQR